jgi:hypothetical protein
MQDREHSPNSKKDKYTAKNTQATEQLEHQIDKMAQDVNTQTESNPYNDGQRKASR